MDVLQVGHEVVPQPWLLQARPHHHKCYRKSQPNGDGPMRIAKSMHVHAASCIRRSVWSQQLGETCLFLADLPHNLLLALHKRVELGRQLHIMTRTAVDGLRLGSRATPIHVPAQTSGHEDERRRADYVPTHVIRLRHNWKRTRRVWKCEADWSVVL